MIKYVLIFLFCLWASTAQAFNLSVTASAPSRSWSDGVLEVQVGDSVTFAMTATGYDTSVTYEWVMGDFGYYKDRYADESTYGSFAYTDEDPVFPFNYPGRYDVKVSVTDAAPVTEVAYISIMVYTVLTPVYAAHQDIYNDSTSKWYGSYAGYCTGMDADNDKNGTNDVTSEIQTCMNALNSGGIIDFGDSNYTYKIVGAIVSERNRGLHINHDLITFYGDAGDPPKMNYDHANDADRGGTDSVDFFLQFEGAEKKFLAHGIHFQYIVPGGSENYEMDSQRFLTSDDTKGYGVFTHSTIEDFSGLSGTAYYQFIKSNIVDWGNGYDEWNGITRATMVNTDGNALFRQLYSLPITSASSNTSHFHYIQADYNFSFENFHYAADPSSNATLFKMYGHNDDIRWVYIQDNYLEGAKWGLGNEELSGGYTLGPVHVKNNYLVESKSSCNSNFIFMGLQITETDIVWSGNYHSNTNCGANNQKVFGFYCGDRSWYCTGTSSCDAGCSYKYDNITIENNYWGDGFSNWTSANINDETSSAWQWGLTNGQPHQDVGVDVTGNTANSTNYQSSTRGGSGPADPGPWEFTAPVNGGNSASGGSGFGTTRWPFNHTGYIQFAHADGETFSEINNCTNSDCSVSPGGSFTQSRFADNDGNLSGLAAYTVLGGTVGKNITIHNLVVN
jgi:hypothetical protein